MGGFIDMVSQCISTLRTFESATVQQLCRRPELSLARAMGYVHPSVWPKSTLARLFATKAPLISRRVSLHIPSCLVSSLTYLSISCWANSLSWYQGRCVPGWWHTTMGPPDYWLCQGTTATRRWKGAAWMGSIEWAAGNWPKSLTAGPWH